MIPLRLGALVAAAFFAVSAPAFAHVRFENGAGASRTPPTRPSLRIPHGCAGEPTLKVRVRIPEGIVAVKPMPKAGWKLETAKGAYVKAYQVNGEAVAEGVTRHRLDRLPRRCAFTTNSSSWPASPMPISRRDGRISPWCRNVPVARRNGPQVPAAGRTRTA